jgi:hypothetical protein
MHLSPITKAQTRKIVKATLYAFVSTFIAAVIASNFDLSKTALVAALVAGINGSLVALKQAFTEA